MMLSLNEREGLLSYIAQKPLIAIIDDDDAVRNSLDVLLSFKGMDVITCRSAKEFLEYELLEPHVAIIDINMPDMDGFQLLDLLKSRKREFPAILVTGLPEPTVRSRALAAGASGFFDKPIDSARLISCIHNLLIQNDCT